MGCQELCSETSAIVQHPRQGMQRDEQIIEIMIRNKQARGKSTKANGDECIWRTIDAEPPRLLWAEKGWITSPVRFHGRGRLPSAIPLTIFLRTARPTPGETGASAATSRAEGILLKPDYSPRAVPSNSRDGHRLAAKSRRRNSGTASNLLPYWP